MPDSETDTKEQMHMEGLDDNITIVPSTCETPTHLARDLNKQLRIVTTAEATGPSNNNTCMDSGLHVLPHHVVQLCS